MIQTCIGCVTRYVPISVYLTIDVIFYLVYQIPCPQRSRVTTKHPLWVIPHRSGNFLTFSQHPYFFYSAIISACYFNCDWPGSRPKSKW